jgi:hypothetical protein
MIDEIKPPKPMDDAELLSIIDHERNLAHGYHDELSEQRRKALYYYMGEAKEDLVPPEIDGRSAVVSKDVMEAVEWALPSLIRIFTSSDDVIAFLPNKAGQEMGAAQSTKYCNWVLNGDSRNNGFILWHDAIKNSLIQRMAWVKVYYEKVFDERQETYQGLSPDELMMLQQDPEVQIVSVQQTQEAVISPEGMMVSPPMVTVTCIRREDASYCKVVGVPPEEVFVSKDNREIEDVRAIFHERKMTASDLVSLGVPRETVAELGIDNGSEDGEETERDDMASKWGQEEKDGADESQRQITVVEAYMKIDYDKDGVSEWRCIKKSGQTILSNDVVDDHPFALACPILMPYQLVGLSMYDLLADLQRIKTSLQRQLLDNIYQQNNARTEVVQNQVNLDDLLNPRPGGIIRVKNAGALREIITPNLIGNSLESISFFDGVRQRRSGVTEMGSGLSPESVNKQQAGITVDLLQQAARERIELIARVYAETFVKRVYRLILKCATQYQKDAQQILVGGQFLEVNPRDWARSYNVQVSVGLGAQSKQGQIANYQQLLMLQQQLLPLGIATPQHVANAAAKLVEAMGHKDAGLYVVDPSKGQQIQPPPPQPDPNQALAQAQVQSEQIKAQSNQQQAQLDAQVKQQELILEGQKARLQAETDIAVARIQADKDIAIAAAKDQTQRDVENGKLAVEVQKDVLPAIDSANSLSQVAQVIGEMKQEMDSFKQAVGDIMSRPKKRAVKVNRDQTGRLIGAEVVEE